MFKKRNIEKKVDLNKDIQTIEIRHQEKTEEDKNSVPKSNHSKKIAKADKEHANADQKTQQPKRMKYGLIQKQIPEVPQRPKEQNSIQKLYVKMHMLEMNKKNEKQEGDNDGVEIKQMAKQYMAGDKHKIIEYDVKEIQKKLQKLATEAIKNEQENRNKYLVDLLQNQYEKKEYASKKELKVMKQERQRLEKELSSKYTNEGRRHYIQYLKHENLNG